MPRPLAHHLFTSFNGQRTVHVSPSLAALLPVLEARAQVAYHHPGGWECLHAGGRWLLTSVVANGTDHVGRPRQLVHQVALDDEVAPPVFSPLWLRRAVLPRLDNPEPAAIAARLAHDFDALDTRTLMPEPAVFADLLRSPLKAVAGALLHALSGPGRSQTQVVPGLATAGDRVAAVMAAALVHAPVCRITTLPEALPTWPGVGSLPQVSLSEGDQGVPGGTMMFGGGAYPSDWILDAIAQATQPARVLFLLRRLPLDGMLSPAGAAMLKPVFRPLELPLGKDGVPEPDMTDERTGAWLAALVRAGGTSLVAEVLSRWSRSHPGHDGTCAAAVTALNGGASSDTADMVQRTCAALRSSARSQTF